MSTGTLAPTLGNVTSAIAGNVWRTQVIDLDLDVQIAWTLTQFAGKNGTIVCATGDVTMGSVGTFNPAGTLYGTIAVTLEELLSAIPGTYVDPANEIGSINVVLDALTAAIHGDVAVSPSRTGTWVSTLDPITGALSGVFGDRQATITTTLDAITSQIAGIFIEGYVVLGQWVVTLDDLDFRMRGNANVSTPVITPAEFTVEFESGRYDLQGEPESFELVELP